MRSWKESRYGFAGFCLVSLLAGWFALRLVLFFAFRPAGVTMSQAGLAFLSGFHRDFFVAALQIVPLLCWLLITPDRRFRATWHRFFWWSITFLWCFAQIFLLFVEFFFFEEFKSRFNTVALDYLLYPYEVFVNIWQSYHVGLVLAACGMLSLGWVWGASRLFRRMWEHPFPAPARWLRLGAVVALLLALSFTFRLKGAHIGTDRTLNEIANNGALSFFAAAWTHHLDYSAFYKTMPKEQAYQRARQLLTETNTTFVEDGLSIRRRVAGDPARPRLNVVIFLEESLGSEFWGCLGRKDESLTPEMDNLAAREGLLFANIYASGNRTVRGMEGVLSSFPPLPGDSIVKRDLSDNVETLARVLKRDGYSTLFLYGGRGIFDGMRSFALRNGYDHFIEQHDFLHPTFTTIWGVCDEDLFDRGIEEFRELNRSGKPFFGTFLSVSNHKPYTYPKGRIPEDPDQKRRENAVKYSDFALGEFFRKARNEAFWTNSIFVVIADHGARVYGSQSIPIGSYEIPLVVVGPAVIQGPARNQQLGCSLDVAPTVLGMVGRPYETLFLGRDLLRSRPEQGRVCLNHNRDIGLLERQCLAVLGLMQTSEFYTGNPKTTEMRLLPRPTEADLDIEKDAIALYQVADDLYTHQRYRLDSGPEKSR